LIKKRNMNQLYYEIFESLPRQGPGDDEATERAWRGLTGLPVPPEILDVGCGTGGQTLTLARLSPGNITALDNHPPFIETLRRNAAQSGYGDRIRCLVGDMGSMNLPEGSFDLIWSEGAANMMGLENALHAWRPLLRPGGYLAISELVWFRQEVPPEIGGYFAEVYPDIKYYEHIYPVIKSAGYDIIAHFPLADSSWWREYYTPAAQKIAELRAKYGNDPEAQAVFDSFQLEMDMHRKYSPYYGYGFYTMRRTA
jgi:SAM-dependent methyltransferase